MVSLIANQLQNVEISPFNGLSWAHEAANLIHNQINLISKNQGQCSVMLTGGRSAEQLYGVWSELPEFQLLKAVHFYFGDERCVPANHPDSNYGMSLRSLFQHGVPSGCSLFRMEADCADRKGAAQRYECLFPAAIDVLLLGVGEDGHIASLFPNSPALKETSCRVVPVDCPKAPAQRLTVTPTVIQSARNVFILAFGKQKRVVYEEALQDPDNIDTIPARLVLNRTWIIGD